MAKRKQNQSRRMTIYEAFSHLTDVSNRVHRERVSLQAQLDYAVKIEEPDLISALHKMIAYEDRTTMALCTVGNWFRSISAMNSAFADMVGNVPDLGEEVGTLNSQRSIPNAQGKSEEVRHG